VISHVLLHLPVLLRGRPLHGAARYRPFFIIGSGRCGSTLLRAILEAHPDVHTPPDTPLGPVMREYRRYSRLPWNAVLRIVLGHYEYGPNWDAFELSLRPLFRELAAYPRDSRNLAALLDGVYRAHAAKHKPSATRWGDKATINTFALSGLRRVFPDLQVIHMIRDGRDVVRSYMRRSTQTLSWAANLWLQSVRTAQGFGARHPGQYLDIRYEELVRHPREKIQAVATFLDVGFDERMLRHHELDLSLGDVRQLPTLEGARDPIHQTAIGRWRTEFDPAQIAELDRLLGPTLGALGYESDARNAGRPE
jgi:hypothetical protein